MTDIDKRTHIEVRHGIKGENKMTAVTLEQIQDIIYAIEIKLENHIKNVETLIVNHLNGSNSVDRAAVPNPSPCAEGQSVADSEDHPGS